MSHAPPRVDCHVHVFCWGEDPRDGYLSQRTRRSWLTRLLLRLTGVLREPGETLTDKMRHRLFRHLDASQLDAAVVLAQDAVYRENGSRDDAATHFYVSNDYVLRLANEHPRVLAGCSINPIRRDAVAELERCHAAGCRLIKVHTAIQGVDPDLPRFDPFYRRAAELGVVLMFHTGYEHSCTVVSQAYADPTRLARPLDFGLPVIAAHCGTCTFLDPEDFYPRFVDMMNRYDNLYGDTAVMAGLIRCRSLARLSREPAYIRSRILHGSDYPLPPSRMPFVFRTGLFPAARHNPLDMDLAIKESFGFSAGYTDRVLELMGLSRGATPAFAVAEQEPVAV